MDQLEPLLMLLPAALLLSIYIGLAVAVSSAADMRGRSDVGWFVAALFVSPLIAGIMVLVLAPKEMQQEQNAIQRGRRKKCPTCAELVKPEAIKCRHCGESFYAPPQHQNQMPPPLPVFRQI